MTNLVSPRTLILLSLVLTAVACTSRSRSIDVPLPKPVEGSDDGSTDGDGAYKNADATLQIPKDVAAKYLDPNAKADFKFTYLDIPEQNGEVQFVNGAAIIELTALPSGLEGTMELQIFENGALKLKGSKAGVTLQAGKNTVKLTLEEVDDGAGGGTDTNTNTDTTTNADLSIEIDVVGAGGSTDPGTATDPAVGTGGAPTFTDVKAIAVKSCDGACHYHKDGGTEGFFTARNKTVLTDRINGNGTFPIMPPPDTDESKGFSASDKQKLLDYIGTLP